MWRQENVTLPSFYWLSVSPEEAKHGMEIRVSRKGNTVTIEKNDYADLTIHFNDEMFDLDKPISIIYNGKVTRTLANITDEWNSRKDKRYLFPAKLTVKNNSEVK